MDKMCLQRKTSENVTLLTGKEYPHYEEAVLARYHLKSQYGVIYY